MMIDTRSSQLQKSLLGEMTPDAGWIDSQIGVLKSQNVAAYLVKQLHLAEDRAFIRSDPGPFDRLLARLGFGGPEPQSEAERTAAATAAVSPGLNVRRIGQSYLLSIGYEYKNPDLAIKIANGAIDAYIFDQLNAKYQANRRAGRLAARPAAGAAGTSGGRRTSCSRIQSQKQYCEAPAARRS